MAKENKEQIALWEAFRSGEEQAFSRLFFDHYQTLFHYGCRISPNPPFVKDILQDFFLDLFESRARLAPHIHNLKAYLITSFRRRLLAALKKERKANPEPAADVSEENYPFELSMEKVIIREENRSMNKRLIAQLLSELPPRQREIIYLKYYLDLSLPEISETLSISYQVVANHLYRALKKLQESPTVKKHFKLDIWLWLALYPYLFF